MSGPSGTDRRPAASSLPARPRYGRVGLLGGAVLVTLVTMLGGLGVLPTGGDRAYADAAEKQAAGSATMALAGDDGEPTRAPAAPEGRATSSPSPASPAPLDGSDQSASHRAELDAARLPADSGTGRRVVFDMSAQRVWLVGGGDRVRRTYLVSGSLTDNLVPGSYSVYSRSARAWGVDDSGSMEFMVRFARGERAAIGFHSIPVKDGVPVQSRDQLGTPQSHGCIRQARKDAKALWDFAPIGTPVVVTT
jgi:L,D-transpeptidase-like protein